jgi:hypothetical protein
MHIFPSCAVTQVTRRSAAGHMRNFLIDRDTASDEAVMIMMARGGKA